MGAHSGAEHAQLPPWFGMPTTQPLSCTNPIVDSGEPRHLWHPSGVVGLLPWTPQTTAKLTEWRRKIFDTHSTVAGSTSRGCNRDPYQRIAPIPWAMQKQYGATGHSWHRQGLDFLQDCGAHRHNTAWRLKRMSNPAVAWPKCFSRLLSPFLQKQNTPAGTKVAENNLLYELRLQKMLCE